MENDGRTENFILKSKHFTIFRPNEVFFQTLSGRTVTVTPDEFAKKWQKIWPNSRCLKQQCHDF
jgi:hypothetical protein